MDLESQKIDILFSKRDIEAVRKEIKNLRQLQNDGVQAIADYYEARIEIYNQNWLEPRDGLTRSSFRFERQSQHASHCIGQPGRVSRSARTVRPGFEGV